ncbi:hypothetical protein PNOK_0113500 [Pyrrhoderma noxium]|uniref:Uncharacterized protein n=1 Tax=Pyrrhoderma noxium TaxID=2282107 RepID=A0A286UWU1_9AGAM|nr:hypothetical protein PNOK_0113500 [Pyrrhoderma noxium]
MNRNITPRESDMGNRRLQYLFTKSRASNNDNYKAARFLGNRLELPTSVRIGVSLLNTPQAADCSKN